MRLPSSILLALSVSACAGKADPDEGAEGSDTTEEVEDSDIGSEGSEGTDDPEDTEDSGAPADPLDPTNFDPILLTPKATTVAEANNAFAFDVLGKVAGGDDNLFFSPFSLFSAFSMVWAGSKGATADELAQALHIEPLAAASWHADYGDVMAALLAKDPDGACDLSVANAIFVQQDATFEETFFETCEEDYGAAPQSMDFAGDPEGSLDAINAWAAEQTDDLIQDVATPSMVNNETRLVLANAILFGGQWMWAFDEASTSDGTFTKLDGTTVTSPVMSMELDLTWSQHDGAYLARLLYGCGDLSMILIVPTPGTGEDIRDLEGRMDAAWLKDATASWSVQDGARLSMPRFSFDLGIEHVRTTMEQLGVETLWTGGSDLSGISSDPLSIGGARHRAFVSVHEKGTEAAAVTIIGSGIDSDGFQENFLLDRPFLFLIRDEAAGVVLFMGRVADPS